MGISVKKEVKEFYNEYPIDWYEPYIKVALIFLGSLILLSIGTFFILKFCQRRIDRRIEKFDEDLGDMKGLSHQKGGNP